MEDCIIPGGISIPIGETPGEFLYVVPSRIYQPGTIELYFMGWHRQILQILGVVVRMGELVQWTDLTLEGEPWQKFASGPPQAGAPQAKWSITMG